MVTAAGLPAWVSVTPIVLVPLPQACWTALVTSSEVMISASSAYSPSPCKPSAARTCKRATGTDSGDARQGECDQPRVGLCCCRGHEPRVPSCLRSGSLHVRDPQPVVIAWQMANGQQAWQTWPAMRRGTLRMSEGAPFAR